MPTRRPIAPLLARFFALFAILANILFISAGRLDWLEAWWFLSAFAGFLTFYGLWALRNDPGQLDERSQVGQNTKGWDKGDPIDL